MSNFGEKLSKGISGLMVLSGLAAIGFLIIGVKWDGDPEIPQAFIDSIGFVFMLSFAIALCCLGLKILEWTFRALTFSPKMSSRTATRLVAGAAIYQIGKNQGRKGK